MARTWFDRFIVFILKMDYSHLSFASTADGSLTLYNLKVAEHYHSKNGALQESIHVFLNMGLRYFLSLQKTEKVNIMEVGFGTGLNFLTTADYCALNKIQVNYTGIEAHPLPLNLISETGYKQYIDDSLWHAFIEKYQQSFKKTIPLNLNCKLKLENKEIINYREEKKFDVIYFDAFAVIRQPEIWSDESLSHVCSFLKPGGVFVTYAITGNLKRCLKSLGFNIQKAPGAAGKREMLRAIKI